jgi:hypothetical protein
MIHVKLPTIFASSRRMGIGAVILDHQGECLADFSDHLLEATTPELADALAIRRAVSFFAHLG